jgi:hypothetical protein
MVALQASKTAFWSPNTAQIPARSVACTPFQTVSRRSSQNAISTLFVNREGRGHSDGLPWERTSRERSCIGRTSRKRTTSLSPSWKRQPETKTPSCRVTLTRP